MVVALNLEAPRIIKRYTVTDVPAIPKGTLLKLSGANIAAAATGSDIFAGIAIEEKTASDGILEIGAAIDGVWDIAIAAVQANGKIVKLSGANLMGACVAADLLTGKACGKLLEKCATDAAVTRVRLGLV